MTLFKSDREPEDAAAVSVPDGRLQLLGLDASSLSALLDGAAATGRLRAVSDLTLGGWRAHQAGHELCAQLDVAGPGGPLRSAASNASLPALIAYGIDQESRGDGAAIVAADVARRISQVLHDDDLVVVLAPRFGATWEREDVLLIEALACEASDGVWELRIGLCADASALPEGWCVDLAAPAAGAAPDDTGLAALVPGVVPADLARSDGPSVALGALLGLIAPERRRSPTSVDRLRYDELTAATQGWVWAYAQLHGNNVFVEPGGLVAEAWQQFAAGAPSIALRLAGHAAKSSSDPHERAAIEVQAQGMRIGAMRYPEAASSPDPPAGIARRLAGLLGELKGWGLTLGDDPDGVREGARLLADARDLLGESEPREELYLLNILALSALKTGNPRRALTLEREIERALGAGVQDACMTYVNALNLARLHRREGNAAEARRQFKRAFATTDGQRSESDRVYANICLARVEEAAGDARTARICWLRASLHLLAARDPQALSRRVLQTLVAQPPTSPRLVPHHVATALRARLAAAADGGIDGALSGPAVHVTPARALNGAHVTTAVGDVGWGVLVCSGPPATPSRTAWLDRAMEPLARAVGALLASLAAQTPLAGATWLGLDDRDGRELPSDELQLRASAARHGAGAVCFSGACAALDEHDRRRLQLAQRLSLGAAVLGVTPDRSGVEVSFMRHRAPVHVTGAGARLIVRLAGGSYELVAACDELELDVDDGLSLAYRLAGEQLISIDALETPCTAAGNS